MLKELRATIPIGIGDILYIKAQLDAYKSKYSCIELCPALGIIASYRDGIESYGKFVSELLDLLFSVPPYKITHKQGHPFKELGTQAFWHQDGLLPQRPRLANCLCAGEPLNIKDYYVITTKIREFPKKQYNNIKKDVLQALKNLKSPLVILGEREVGMNTEYRIHGPDLIYSIYEDLKTIDGIIDLTIPELGLTTPSLKRLRQDALIMSKAKRIITIGIGGGFCMATSVGEVVGYRTDSYSFVDYIYGKRLGKTLVTKNYAQFLKTLRTI